MTAGRLILPLAEPVIDQNGDLNPGATLTVYLTGTTTLAALFGDPGLTEAVTNPQTADAAGRFYAQTTAIYADASQAYDVRLVLTDGESFSYDAIQLLEAPTGGGGFMPISGGTFTGPIYGPTPAANDDSNLYATTAFVQTAVAPLATIESPAFSGTPTAPAPTDTSPSGQLATVGYVQSQASESDAASPGWLQVGAILIQFGYQAAAAGGEGVAITVNFAKAFSNVPYSVTGVARDAAFNGANDMWLKRTGAPTASSATFTTQASGEGPYSMAGVEWVAVGPA